MEANPFTESAAPVLADGTHRCVCEACETERIRDNTERHMLYQLQSAVGAYLQSRQTYGDLAELAYQWKRTCATYDDSW